MTPQQLCHAAKPSKFLSEYAGQHRHHIKYSKSLCSLSPFHSRLCSPHSIDDTLFVSLFDSSVPNGTTYPGLLALYEAVDAGCGCVHGLPVEQGDGNIVFLTARPEGVGGAFEDFTHRYLAKKGIKHATVLSGTLATALGSKAGMAAKKYDNFQKFKAS
jgi:hypothetical protein